MNRNSQDPNNQNFNNQNFDPNYNYDSNIDNTQYNNQYNNQYSNQGYEQQYQNTQYQNTQYQNFEQPQDYNNQQQNYNVPPMYMEEPKEKKKSIIPVVLTAIITFVVLVVGLYFGYNKFLKKENVIDLATYEVNFVTYGAEGEGKPEVDIKKVPEVANSNSNAEISNLLSNPDISFDKQSNLKNGDKVEVTISLNKNTVNKLKLKTTGEFKRTFTVNGLNEKAKEKETIIVKESSSRSSSSSSSGSRRSDERTVYVRPSAGVNLRSSSNDSSSIITAIPVGRSVYQHYIEVNSDGEAWAYVSYGGSNGWIRADLIG
ncbi:hypothetical protein [Gemella haemolysans]|uniref:hypothetical protein n=1 Tax=Gemella haemolysans TaxID=1379 RepID=UPI00195C0C85|nr:hypothetical protein [Gemella haemolysans]VTX62340.1 Bacterial SH3 domain protein [Gemella haemolysans]